MVRTRTAPDGEEGDTNGGEVEQPEGTHRGLKRSCTGEDDLVAGSPSSAGAAKKSRYVDVESVGDDYAFVPRRSTRQVLLETQREYNLLQAPNSDLFDAEETEDEMLTRSSRRYRPKSRSGHHRSKYHHSRRSDSPVCSRRHGKDKVEKEGDEEDEEEEEEGEGDESLVRRSSRQRHAHFESLNMASISKEVMKREEMSLEREQQKQRRRAERNEGHADDGEEEDSSEGELVEVERRRPGLRPRMIKVRRRDLEREGECQNGEEEDSEEEEGEDEQVSRRGYFLREKKPVVERYQAAHGERKRGHRDFRHGSPNRQQSRRYHSLSHRSPAKKHSGSHHHRAHHDSSSTSSSGSASDEGRFERRKSRSMRKARDRCLPMNFTSEDLRSHTVARDRMRIGGSLADIDPMTIDKSVSFDSVGGLETHVHALKEMVVFPLLYPEVFDKFGIQPPRGVLFHGSPGTGKTLVARALANECGALANGQQRVAFFMRKGADCLSKWVGESERQLRLLFDQAYNMRPSIIFFDEIDGLAPVRSTRQDQIHSSIVSTLLALMDGLDSRGEVVVIGATNRIDSIDPALRRPGRFDREFRFPLPNRDARSKIVRIHTKSWNPPLSDQFISMLADRTVGYCGADVKAMCAEVALCALRRTYPQIYTARDKLVLDLSKVQIEPNDFASALSVVVPTTARAHISPAWPLQPHLHPLLATAVDQAQQVTRAIFSPCNETSSASFTAAASNRSGTSFSSFGDVAMYASDSLTSATTSAGNTGTDRHSVCAGVYSFSQASRARLILYGPSDSGVCDHVCPALLHSLEGLPTHTLDVSALFSDSAQSAEQAACQLIREAVRTSPSIIYMPRMHLWWSSLSPSIHATINAQLTSIPPSAQLLILGSAEEADLLDGDLHSFFSACSAGPWNRCLPASLCNGSDHRPFDVASDQRSAKLVSMPNAEERMSFFKPMFVSLLVRSLPTSTVSTQGEATPPVLPVAPPPEPRQLTVEEQGRLLEEEEKHLRELRIFLRDCTGKLLAERKFKAFCKPVDLEEVPDYLTVVKEPLDLEEVMQRIDRRRYNSAGSWLADINLVVSNCIEYNPPTNQMGKVLRHRAFALSDMATSLIDIEMSKKFEQRCLEIEESRSKRGHVTKVPFAESHANRDLAEHGESRDVGHSVRRSLRVHGIQPDDPAEIVKRATSPCKMSQDSPDSCDTLVSSADSDGSPIKKGSHPKQNWILDASSDISPFTPALTHARMQTSSADTLEVPSDSAVLTSGSCNGSDNSPLSNGAPDSGLGEAFQQSNSSLTLNGISKSTPMKVMTGDTNSTESTSDDFHSRRILFPKSAQNDTGNGMPDASVHLLPADNAVHLLGEPSNGLLSSETVELLLERLVVSTEGYSVGKLEGVHASLSHAIQSFVRGPVKKSQTDIVEGLSSYFSDLPTC